ncbi:hypothetical protein DESC_830028 [Desulfosarcina cetonica]|uniref:TIR domain-containing protein n=1 Tax=Desulfosarcina cetonica TaxID=90730 RepID=UPI0006D22825|nr:TIR domain-containing protein [Desulfosarcina cetonica]VTR70711.1 hypothetical protein DESC_830028 [Desulfosarcina cetonica]
MKRQTACELIEAERELCPAVVVLARHLSIAVRIETELIRAMRLRVMPGEEAGVESDLFFSSLVQTRDVSAITLIPEVRSCLHDELSHRQAELDLAHHVIAAAHRDMDAVISLEEAVVYYSLRGDWEAYRNMQIELGTLFQALTQDSVDSDLVRWTAGAFLRLTDRARQSRAGQTLMRTLDHHIDLLRGGTPSSDLPGVGGLPSAVTIGFRTGPKGIELSFPPATGWLALEMPGPLPLSIDVGWPVPGGWQTTLVEVRDQHPAVEIPDAPVGLVRLRGTNGDEIKLRVDGPFDRLRPRLLGLNHDPAAAPGDMIEAQLTDLAWQARWESLWVGSRPLVWVAYAAATGSEGKVVDALWHDLREAGFNPWIDRHSLRSGDDWSAELIRVIDGCHAVVVVLSDASMQSKWFPVELNRIAQRKQTDASLPVHVLLAPGVDPQSAQSMLTGELAWLADIHWAENPADIISALGSAWFGDRTDGTAAAGLLVFNDIKSLLQYRKALDRLEWSDQRLMPELDVLVGAGCPIMARVGDQIRRLAYTQGPITKSDASDPAVGRFHQLVDALDRLVDSATGEMAEVADSRRIFREGLLDGERRAVSVWLSRLADAKRARTPSDPPHAMVMIQWDAWFPKGADAPRHFDTYRSRQERLARLVGNGGTLWVVTSRTDADGNRRYQLAYRLEAVEIVSRPMPVETKASIARDYVVRAPTAQDVLQFPLHDATQTLLQLTFTTGRPMEAPGDIGRRLQSIPQLSAADVDRLNAFTAQFTEAASDGAIRLRCRFRGDSPEGHRGTVRSIVLGADGKMALTAGNSHPDQCVKYWDLDRGVLVQTFEGQALPGGRTPIAFSPDDQLAVVGYEGLLRVLDLGRGKMVHEIRATEEEITAVAFFDDTGVLVGTVEGHLLAVDLKSGQIYWDGQTAVAEGAVQRITLDEGEALILGASGVANVFVGGSPSEIRISWRLDATIGEPALFMQRTPLTLDRKHSIAMFGNPLQFLNLRENTIQQTLETEWPVAEAVNGRVLTTDGESAFRVFDAPYTQPLDEVRIAPERAACAALSADGRCLVIADYEHNLHVYDLPPLPPTRESWRPKTRSSIK